MKRFFIIITSIIGTLTLLFLAMVVGVSIYAKRNSLCALDSEMFENARMDSSTTYYAVGGDGEAVEIWRDDRGGIKTWYSFDEISDNLKKGFISSEDRGFYEHSGVDLKRTVAAVFNTLFHIKPRFGASTITQQVIKNLSGDSEITLKRKLNEIIRAYNLENQYSKEEIFEVYLNIVPMANNLYGVGAASEAYFGKSPSDLSLSESALLVGIINSPARYDPVKHPDEALKKRNNILFAMLDNGAISKDEYDSAINEPIDVNLKESVSHTPMPWYVEGAYNEILDDISREYSLPRSSASMLIKGARIKLNLDPTVQDFVTSYFSNTENFSPETKNGLKYSLVVIDNSSGKTVALAGGIGRKEGDRVLDFTKALITPGSALKPLALYAPLVDSGEAGPASIFNDVPLYYKNNNGAISAYPKNSPNVYDGEICLSDAIAYSKNTVAVEIYKTLGAESISESLIDSFGLSTIDENDMYESPLALGQLTNGVNLRELTRAYTAFPREGVISSYRLYDAVYKKDGSVLLSATPREKRIMSVEGARMMNQLLMSPIERGTAKSIDLIYYIDTAGKTGTSGGSKDKVFIGYTPCYTIGIWCGYADGKTPVAALSPSHLDIWDEIAEAIHSTIDLDESSLNFSTEGLVKYKYSREDGTVYCDECAKGRCDLFIGYFLPSTVPNCTECDKKREFNYIPA